MRFKTFFSNLMAAALLANCTPEESGKTVPNTPAGALAKNVRYLALGDSYTIGTAIGKENSYASLLADSLESRSEIDSVYLKIIAQNGWTTGDLQTGINQTQPDSSFDLVSLLIGVNNQYQKRSLQEYEREFRALLLKSITLAQGRKERVLVLSIPDWGSTPAGAANRSQIAQEIDAFNAVNQALSDSLGVSYYNITPISRTAVQDSSLVANDDLHFSKEMHALWLNKIFDSVAKQVLD